MAIFPSSAIPSGAEAFTVNQSLRFNDNDSAYLSKTFASAGDRKTWTFSCWVKRGAFDTTGQLVMFGGGTSADAFSMFYITKSTAGDPDTLLFYDYNGVGNPDYGWQSAIRVRDPSAWYHIMCVVDTTISSPAADRVKFYVNGVRQSDIETDYGDLAEDYESHINRNIEHNIGKYPSNAQYYDGYLAEIHFIDGTALTPTSFGEEGTYGEWKPKEYDVADGAYGTNGFYLNFAGGGIMSATGGDSIGTDGDYKYNTFLSDGTFTPSADGYVEYLVIGGGGGASGISSSTPGGGGGGAGAYRTGYLAVTADTAYSITVGDGGSGGAQSGASEGGSSIFSTITSLGGGEGGHYGGPSSNAGSNAMASGGGAAFVHGSPAGTGGTYGNDGGSISNQGAGGGGGAGTAGETGQASGHGSNGGDGLSSSITGSAVTRAGGGGGGAGYNISSGGASTGGSGGGGAGGAAGGNDGTAGTANTGGGGGGGSGSTGAVSSVGAAGGSGIVILRYRFQLD